MPENLGGYIGFGVTVIWFVGMLIWFFRRQFGKTRTVKATLINKQINEIFYKCCPTGKKQYYVTFLVNGKRRSFQVSELSYNGYRKGETGTLKYKGDRLIDFS